MQSQLRDPNPLRLLLETTLDAVVVMNSVGTVADWNGRATETFGWSRQEAIGRNMAELIIPERYRDAHLGGLRRFLETGEGKVLGRRVEFFGLRKTGEEFPVELSISSIHDQSGVWFVGCLRDITARKAALEAIKNSERQFQLLVQGVKDCAIYMLDPKGLVSSWNSGAERIKGYRAEEIVGEHFSCFYTEEDARNGAPTRALGQAENGGKSEAEGWRVRKDGSRFWASTVINPIHDELGELIGFAKITRDITEWRDAQEKLKQAREHLFQAQKMESVGQLTGGVAHDFNNLLMVIMGSLEIAQRHLEAWNEGAKARVQRAINNAMRGAQRATSLTQRLLAFSRRQPLNPKPLDVNRFISGLSDFLGRSLGEIIEVEMIGSGGLWQVEVDAAQLEAAILNVALNARDAMPSGGKLTIEACNSFLDHDYCRVNAEVLPGQYVQMAITDTGMGMTDEVLNRAFEPFFTTKIVGQGTGLGLSQVYGFVKQSGGHVKIYSEPGEGTTVKIYIPRFIGDLPKEDAIGSEGTGGTPGETILIVEDDQDVRNYLLEVLRELNFRVLEAQDAVSALSLIDRRDVNIDLLLTDVILPGMNGRQLAGEVTTRLPDIKVLFMTGYSRNAIIHQGRLDPRVEMIQKPITQDALATRIRDLLDAPPREIRKE
jgi:PAS domain S-box-containing protein